MKIYDTPTVIVNYDVAVANVRKMVAGLAKYGVAHRPHIKVHKSTMLAKMQIAEGAHGITCAKVSEAEVMADAGIRDILIANQIIGELKLARLAALCRKADITICVDSLAGATQLSEAMTKAGLTIKVFIEVDSGSGRCGVKPAEAPTFMKSIAALPGLNIVGLMTYSGRIYGKTMAEMPAESRHETKTLLDVQAALKAEGFKLPVLSGGSSLSSRFPEDLSGLTESRAGNYVFNDCTSLFSGLATADECALRVIATITSIPEKGRCIIDAGTKTLTGDGCLYRPGYGFVPQYPEMEIYSLNEEHGYVRYPDTDKLRIGQQISIIPNHACVVPNVNEELIGLAADGREFIIPVEARGKNK